MTVVEGSADDISQRLESRDIDVALLESRRVERMGLRFVRHRRDGAVHER